MMMVFDTKEEYQDWVSQMDSWLGFPVNGTDTYASLLVADNGTLFTYVDNRCPPDLLPSVQGKITMKGERLEVTKK